MHMESNVTEAIGDSQLKMNRGFHNCRWFVRVKEKQQTVDTCCLSQCLS